MARNKQTLKATDIEKLENTSMASALAGAEAGHIDANCVGMSCIGVSGNPGTCSGLGACCTGCTLCSGCTACSGCSGCSNHTVPCVRKTGL